MKLNRSLWILFFFIFFVMFFSLGIYAQEGENSANNQQSESSSSTQQSESSFNTQQNLISMQNIYQRVRLFNSELKLPTSNISDTTKKERDKLIFASSGILMGFVSGLELGLKQSNLEAKFALSTSIFDIPETRDLWETISNVLLAAAGYYLITESDKLNTSDSTKTVGYTIGLTSLINILGDPSSNKAIAQVSKQLAVSRQAYDDTMVRIKQYNNLLDQVSPIKDRLVKLVGELNKVEKNKGIISDDLIKEYISIGNELGIMGTSIDGLIRQMVAQTDYYITISEKGTYIKELADKFKVLRKEADILATDFIKDYLPLFNLIPQTMQEFLITT
ncbi:MAG TPA: hypothetical protein VHY08_06185 [Bacillota bacterium]|nr:hypothetical protein [Bacillota bacterium]